MKAAERHGLAGRAGFNDTIGVLGYTLGGGYGWLSRQHGLASDHITAADLVLANGSAVRVSADEHADLFWALRGGSGIGEFLPSRWVSRDMVGKMNVARRPPMEADT